MATIRDVAEEAGVSIATVSRVLNSSQAVAPKTRERVTAAISKLQYSPSTAAAELRRLHKEKEQRLESESMLFKRYELSKQPSSSIEKIKTLRRENRELKRAIRQFGRYLRRWQMTET